jgi:hypothetical protein
MQNDSYQGWTNRETWLVNLWLTNEEHTYQSTRGMNAESLESYVETILEDDSNHMHAGFITDLIGAALIRVNWNEIADSINAE